MNIPTSSPLFPSQPRPFEGHLHAGHLLGEGGDVSRRVRPRHARSFRVHPGLLVRPLHPSAVEESRFRQAQSADQGLDLPSVARMSRSSASGRSAARRGVRQLDADSIETSGAEYQRTADAAGERGREEGERRVYLQY